MPVLVGGGEHDMLDFHEGGEGLVRDLDAGGITVISGAGNLAPFR